MSTYPPLFHQHGGEYLLLRVLVVIVRVHAKHSSLVWVHADSLETDYQLECLVRGYYRS